jgi:hypothetical protein
VQVRQVLKEIVARVKQLVDPAPVAAQDVGGHAMQLLALRQFHAAANHRGMRQFDVGIEKQNVIAVGLGCAQVAAHRGHSAADHADVQAVAETENDFRECRR